MDNLSKKIIRYCEGIAKEDRLPLLEALEKYPDDFVHFTDTEMVNFRPVKTRAGMGWKQ